MRALLMTLSWLQVLAAALNKGHDSIVLSALGCGAFGNPPAEVARIFHASLSNFNGLFKKVVFAIIDDHNSTSAADGKSNFQVFSKFFKSMPLDNPASELSEINFAKYKVCDEGSACKQGHDREHMKHNEHPFACPHLSACTNFDPVHRLLFTHRCPKWGMCDEWQDKAHSERFAHPRVCEQKEQCTNTDEHHRQHYLHLPLCELGHECPNSDSTCKKRHEQLSCQYGPFCPEFEDVAHWKKWGHPQPQVCEYAATCKQRDPEHLREYAHICPWGWQCKDRDKPGHQASLLHIRRAECPAEADGSVCQELCNDDHLDLYSHKGVRDIRINCERGAECADKKTKRHYQQYKHTPPHKTFVACQPCVSVGTVGTEAFEVDFAQNHADIEARVDKAVFGGGTLQPDPDIVDWAARVRPQHRCRLDIFQSMLVHGTVMSSTQMKSLKDPKGRHMHEPEPVLYCTSSPCGADTSTHAHMHTPGSSSPSLSLATAPTAHPASKTALIFSCPLAIAFSSSHKGAKKELVAHPDILKFAGAVCKQGGPKIEIVVKKLVAFVNEVVDMHYGVPIDSSQYRSRKSNCRSLLKGCGENFTIAKLEELAQEFAEASKNLGNPENYKGIGYKVDEEMKADETVFAIMGPHIGYYYGCIILIFKQDIMAHPDFSTTCGAGTSHASGRARTFKWKELAWPATKKTAANGADRTEHTQPERSQRILKYHTQKINAALPGFHEVIAKELAAATPKGSGARLSDVIKRHNWNTSDGGVDSHYLFEGHLPAVCPFSTVDKIIFPKHDYALLSDHEKEQLEHIFPLEGQIIVTESAEPPPALVDSPDWSARLANYHKTKNGELQTELLRLSREHALEPKTSVMPSGFS